ncbi:Protein of unknown function [Pyronema omphalodes CBS 100304]|uniref:Uncharacterized protein n=1 Tax=Pyronema omphalodes (strain CBS 100304) TaxID=1076935 RepID=U4L823_PYROM|nr:Protein of unknown function [Pyronema omphalodes CBS 100304]
MAEALVIFDLRCGITSSHRRRWC